jgi:hypothetical protein
MPNNFYPYLILAATTHGAIVGIFFALLVFVTIVTGGLYYKYVRKSGWTSKVYVSPNHRMSIYALPEGVDPTTNSVFGETVEKDIFVRSEIDEIPSFVEPDSINENFFGIEPPTTMDENAYGSEPPMPPMTDDYKHGQEPSV